MNKNQDFLQKKFDKQKKFHIFVVLNNIDMAYEWFISYRRGNDGESQAQKFAEILSKYVGKDKIFFDRVFMREGNWREIINEALNTAKHFVLLANNAPTSRDQVNYIGGYGYEVEAALKLNKNITLIEYDKDSYEKLTAQYPELKFFQKITFNGEYDFAFEERLCGHFGFDSILILNNNMPTINLFDKKGTTNYLNKNKPIYITYARNDKSNPEWEHISDIKDIIVKKFKENNIDVYDDDGDLKGGDNITDFENEIGDSEFTILIFSDKYFHSHHCMYELVQVMKAYNSGKKRKLVCIKSGNCNLKDDRLRQYWIDYGGERFKEELMGNKLTDIQQAAKNNGYYLEYIKDLYPFFTKCKYIDVENLNLDTLINDFKVLFEADYFLYIDDKKSGPFDLRTLKRKLRSLPKTTLVWKRGMEKWEMAINLPELKDVFPIEPPPIPKDYSMKG